MGDIIKHLEDKLQADQYQQEKAYLVALASAIRDTEPGSTRHQEILWVIRHQDRIRRCRKLIELIEP